MSGKVIHLTDDTHAKMMEFCNKHKIHAKAWVENLIVSAIEDHNVKKIISEIPLPKPAVIEPVKKKKLPDQPPNVNDDDPFTRPPFWANR